MILYSGTAGRSSGVRRRWAMRGVVLTGVVLCLLVTSVYGGGAPVVNTALNNSVVSAELAAAVPQVATPCPTCTSSNASASEAEHETLAPTKGAEAASDPLVRTNHIGLARYAAGSAAEEIPGQHDGVPYSSPNESNSQGRSRPAPTVSTFEETLRRLSEAASREYESSLRAYSSSTNIQPSASVQDVSETKGSQGDWTPIIPPTRQTPQLPNLYSREQGVISTTRYDVHGEPSTYRRSSTTIVEDNTSSGVISTRAFSYIESFTPIIAPTTVQVETSTSRGFDVHLSGSTTQEHTEEENKGESSSMSNKATSAVPNDAESAASSVQNNSRTSSLENLNNSTSVVTSTEVKSTTIDSILSDDLFGTNKTEINSKLLSTERDHRRENESINKNLTTEGSESTKILDDMEVSMASQVVTMAAVSTTPRNRFRPTENISRIVSLWRGSSRYGGTASQDASSTPENVFLASESESSSTVRTQQDLVSSSSSSPVLTTVRSNLPTTETTSTQIPLVTTHRGDDIATTWRGMTSPPGATTIRNVVSIEPEITSQRMETSNKPEVTTYRGSTAQSSTNTEQPSTSKVETSTNNVQTSTSSEQTSTNGAQTSTNSAQTSTTSAQTSTNSAQPSTISAETSTNTTQSSTTSAQLSTTTAHPAPDTQGEESSVECTTMEDSVVTDTTSKPEESTTVVHRTSTYRTRSSTSRSSSGTRAPHRSSSRTRLPHTEQVPTEEEPEASTTMELITTAAPPVEEDTEFVELLTEATSRRTSSAPPTYRSNTLDETEAPPTDEPRLVKSFLHLTVATTWEELCRGQDDFKQGVAALLTRSLTKEVTAERVVLLNEDECMEPPPASPAGIVLQVYLSDERGEYDQLLTEAFPRIWAADPANKLQITCVEVRQMRDMTPSPNTATHGNIVAVIAIASVAVACLLLLLVLMLVMRKRQKRYNYGQRCTPVSLDAYSLDSVSVYNSVRRKGHLRASKRSYGNPAFDDPNSPSHPVNFAGLANCIGDVNALQEEFSMVPTVTVRMEELPPGADAKNRYANVIPLPETRVPLSRRGSDHLSEYINANFVRGPKNAPKYYIACQAPLESTVCDFWRMIWEHQCKVMLMLTDLEENGVEKCADYLPPSEVLDCHRRFGDFHVTLKKREVRDNYAVSTLQLKNMETNLWREVTHLWFFGWPAAGVPEEPSSLIAFLLEARAFMKSNAGPTVVHCSPGTGRAGTVLACDLCIREFEQSRMVDVPRVVHRLRRDRAGAVQTREQYVFIYQVLNVYAAKLTGGAMDSF